MSAWTYRHADGKAATKIVPPRLRIPCWKGLSADSEEKHEPVSDIDTAVVVSLKVLDPKRPIREADVLADHPTVCVNGERENKKAPGAMPGAKLFGVLGSSCVDQKR
jgi:hypothetical protein